MAFIQGWHLLSSTSRVAIIIGVLLNEVIIVKPMQKPTLCVLSYIKLPSCSNYYYIALNVTLPPLNKGGRNHFQNDD